MRSASQKIIGLVCVSVFAFSPLQPVLAKQAAETCKSNGGVQGCSRVLFSLPKTLQTYQKISLQPHPIQLFTDERGEKSVLSIKNRWADKQVFINGKFQGNFDAFAASSALDAAGEPFAFYGSGGKLFLSNHGNDVRIASGVLHPLERFAAESLLRCCYLNLDQNNLDKAKQQWIDNLIAQTKEQYASRSLAMPSDQELRQSALKELDWHLPPEVAATLEKAQKGTVTLTELFRTVYFGRKNEMPRYRNDLSIDRVFTVDAHRILIFLSTNSVVDIQDGTMTGLYDGFASGSTQNAAAAFDPATKQIAFRALDLTQKEKGVMWTNGAIGPHFNAGMTPPRFSPNGDILYTGVNVEQDETHQTFTCSAVVGKQVIPFSCNDEMFASSFLSPGIPQFPRVSPDGKTTIYPELVASGAIKDGSPYPHYTPFRSRLVINGKPQATHPWLDTPYFTSKGLAMVTHTESGASIVDWNGKRSGPFLQLLPPPGDDNDASPEIVVSPDGLHTAFTGYRTESGWTLFRDMEPVQSFAAVTHVMFSPDSRHLAYVVVSTVGLDSWAGSYNSLPISGIPRNVMEDGRTIGTYDEVRWIDYAPKDGSLWYVAKNKGKMQVFRGGKPVGVPFDEMVMDPSFSKDGALSLGVVKGKFVTLLRFALR